MNVLITGGAGFIGTNFVYFVGNERPDWQVTVVDVLSYAGNVHNIKPLIDQNKIQFVKADISDIKAMDSLFSQAKYDLVFNFAAESHVDRSIHGASAFVTSNVLGTQALLDAARANGVTRFVQISTDEVYGSLGPTGTFKETTPLDPTSPYAASKAASDLMVLAAHKTHNFDALITRCTNNYGPYQFPEKLIPLFVTNAIEGKAVPLYGDGLNVRSWIHVEDHCRGILLVAEKGLSGEIYNIGSGAEGELTNIEVTKTILKLLSKPESLIQKVADRPAHDRRYAVDSSKIQAELGWKPQILFSDGIKQTIDWYINESAWWHSVKSGDYRNFYDLNYGKRAQS